MVIDPAFAGRTAEFAERTAVDSPDQVGERWRNLPNAIALPLQGEGTRSCRPRLRLKTNVEGRGWEGVGPDAETTAAASALTSVVLERDLARLREWLAREPSADPAWRRAAFLTESLMYLTRDELEALGLAITEQVLAYSDRIDPSLRPEGAAPVQVVASGFPLPPTTTGN